jgi:vancomycin aglycone glucosyltransferase
MRASFSTIGSRGDVQPVVALASHLEALGQEVRFSVPADFRDWVESFGIPGTPIGPAGAQVRCVPSDGRAAASDDGNDGRDIVRDVEFCRARVRRDCRSHQLQVAARSVAEKLGITCVFAAYAPVVLPSPHHALRPLPPLPGQAPPTTNDNSELWDRMWNGERS